MKEGSKKNELDKRRKIIGIGILRIVNFNILLFRNGFEKIWGSQRISEFIKLMAIGKIYHFYYYIVDCEEISQIICLYL